MRDAAEDCCSSADENQTEQLKAASAAAATPTPAPSALSSAGGSSSSGLDQQSFLLQNIKSLVDTQKALQEQKKRCAQEIRNDMDLL